MTLFKAAVLGICAAILALSLKPVRGEYSTMLSLAAGGIIFTFILVKLDTMIQVIRQIGSYISVNPQYIGILIKIIGVSYLCEFSASLCKDAGYQTIASQIEIAGKLTILVMSMPVLLALLDTVGSFLQ
ncbi:stage III sporulation protein AD [Catenibacillus scindens]|uniref:Stage III sporulation protein AD n=1 Tax=Catenibacillus scindens TaxID=673271 RepID=A0A7W8HB57_9FIRM|nr:stage III sporulation protein AD [Catenibacillus scindens]MBB5264500.1 stage III sporulation protein AD [Catenibacillus scindens]